ncbi:MAG TPA: acyl-CoA dehydrogenase family protein [Actinophytocola sp.]|uniref:acyl-CoA dehydrogenase family protein n=1 Tax=Actinophytocola sp. TaxID=1872138 RepID=UPI002DDD068F|nr:acyl-CoA dehydrogenase family protein [Actinophytocola sp.]HEV2781740.1 acyl-CoA dehydrogenase family protein [Actinophytocola sp.]
MDFALDDTQRTIAAVARETLARESDETAWKALSRAGLLALPIPERLGGEGLGALETAVLLTEVGRAAAPLPALQTLALGVLPIAWFGTERQQEELLPDVASGDRVLTSAPRGSATVDDGRLTGSWVGVAYASAAHRVLVPVGSEVYIVDPHADGVTLIRTPTSSGVPEFTLRLDRVPAESLGGHSDELHRLAVACGCVAGAGLLAGALDLTAGHVRSRAQFGRPLATFQAVAQQIADVYIAARTMHLAAWAACWRLEAADVDVAGLWLAEEALPALHTCHHLHGGLGVDMSYPLHRYYSMTKDLVRWVGHAH